jgi:hypothetical protein
MNRGSKTIAAAGLAALATFGMTLGSATPASAYWHRYHAWHHWHHPYYAWHRHYYYGPGPVLGGLGLLAGTAAALVVGPYPYYGPYYHPYWW